MLSFFFFFRFWISILVLGSLWLFLPSSSKSMRLVVFDESDSSSFHQGLGFHKEIGFPRKNRFLKSQRPTLRYDASSLPQDGSASSTFDIHSKNPVLDLVESSSNESASACVESFLKLVQAIASSEDERFLSRIILCSNETIVFDHAIDISNKCLQIQCQLSTSPSLCVLKGSSKSGLFQAIDSSHHSMSFQGVTFCGGSSEFGSVVQVIVSSRDSASDPRMKNCYASSPPFAANPKLDFLECTFQDNVASSAGGALYLRGPGGSSRLTGCVFRNNTATHVRTVALCVRTLDFRSLARVINHSLANDSLQSSNDTR
jgi:hypothetical protein